MPVFVYIIVSGSGWRGDRKDLRIVKRLPFRSQKGKLEMAYESVLFDSHKKMGSAKSKFRLRWWESVGLSYNERD
jgi:hypothetical protein